MKNVESIYPLSIHESGIKTFRIRDRLGSGQVLFERESLPLKG